MEINPNNPVHYQPSTKMGRKAGEEDEKKVGSDSFSGPSTESKIQKLKETDGFREDVVNRVREEMKNGEFFTEERLQRTVDQLLHQL